MFCCYLIHHGRISQRHEIAVATLHEAIAHGRQLLSAHPVTSEESGIEIWRNADLLYSDQRHTNQTGIPAPLGSPFATAESTMLPTTYPSQARSLASVMFTQDPGDTPVLENPHQPRTT